MRSIGWSATVLLVSVAALVPRPVAAQTGDPDLREIQPYLMLVIDTSGSMERLPACTCTTLACEECLPDCGLTNVDGAPPEGKKNRWAITLEALTGTFQNFECESLARTADNGATYDLGYYLPYHQPWDCSGGGACSFDSVQSTLTQPGSGQDENGVLDQYIGRIRFGLMTFDGWDTYVGAPPLVPAVTFDHALSNSVQGLWSYGGGKAFHYPGCDVDYMIDTGARSAVASEGSLISLNSCTGGGAPGSSPACPSWCFTCDGNEGSINRDIQEALLSVRPYGGTPIAGSLDDLYYHFKSDLTDAFGGCRNRYALLLTDGYPDPDYRDVDCNCANEGDPMDQYRCGPDPTNPRWNPDLMKCPYPTAAEAARDLVRGREGDPPQIERLYVVGLAVEDTNVLAELNLIATEGCTEENCEVDEDGNEAFFAANFGDLVGGLENVISDTIRPISRSVPVLTPGITDLSSKQYQLSAGFLMPDGLNQPRTGILERIRFQCLNGVPTPQTLGPSDRFHEVLNAQATRRLLTAIPPGESDWPGTDDPNGWLYSGEPGAPCDDANGCQEVDLDDIGNPETFGLTATDTQRRTEILNWTYAINGVRTGKRLGDIYHSSPVLVGPPRFDTADEAFNEFRASEAIAGRPLTLFVGSNDGILHAFSVEAHTDRVPPIAAGEELWGFIPPLLLDDLEDNLGGVHRFSMDGTPAVKDVYFNRVPGHTGLATDYHTVLITGMREGGNAYIALDVTDPVNPKFLWQFTDPQMGKTFAQPAIGQARYRISNGMGGFIDKEGAVAILSGGVGAIGAASGECANGASNPTMRTSGLGTVFKTYRSALFDETAEFSHRSDVRCWQDRGRALYFVEVETGRLIKKIYTDGSGNRVFPSPLVSTPAIYQADIGTLMTKAFVVDADGVIWRIDMSAANPEPDDAMAGWTARPFHDIFFDAGPSEGELTYEAPVLTVDEDGRLVVLVGTGDTNNFVKPTVKNRIVSVTEREDLTPANVERFRAALNWEIRVTGESSGTRLVESELVTGTMALFNGTLFVGTFISTTGGDACELGKGRIFAVHFNQRTNDENGSAETYPPVVINAGTGLINATPDTAASNVMLMGLNMTQRPSCEEAEAESDVFGQSYADISAAHDSAMYLVAQASGSNDTVLRNLGSSQLNSIELQVQPPRRLTRVLSWATSVD